MFRKRILLGIISLLAGIAGYSQQDSAVLNYINTYKELAIEEMQRTGVPAAIKLAQGIHETQAGQSDLVLRSNNHFGIKCKSTWTGDRVYHDDDKRAECFRSYASAADSWRDHSDFLKNNQRYASLFQLDPTDYKSWAYGLKKAGYATNTRYPELLIRLIEKYDLEKYTLIAMGKLPKEDEILADKRNDADSTGIFSAPELSTVNYPQGEFTLNRTRVVFAMAGTSLLVLANQYGITLKHLVEFNELENENILPQNQLVFLQRKRRLGATPYHITIAGEDAYRISQAEGIRLESLLAFNHLERNMKPLPGSRIYLQEAAAERPPLAMARPVMDNLQRGETLTVNGTNRDTFMWSLLAQNGLMQGIRSRIHKASL